MNKSNPTLIGAFVLGGITLLVLALFLFGGSGLFTKTTRFVSYFQGSVAGLSVGAPVTFRGVRVGTVTNVVLEVSPTEFKASIPVFFEIEPDRITFSGETDNLTYSNLRARLAMTSFVTGQMQIELDIDPDTPANLTGRAPEGVIEIASVLSSLDQLKTTFADLPLGEIASNVDRAMSNLNQMLASERTQQTIENLAAASEEVRKLMAAMSHVVPPMLEQWERTAKSVETTSAQMTRTIGTVDSLADKELRATMQSASQAMERLNETIAGVNSLVGPQTASREDLEVTLRNLAQASRSLKIFAETVERNPNTILLGR